MSTDSTPRLWRSGGPTPPGAGRRARLRLLLIALAALVGVGIALVYWLSPPREVAVLPVTITASPWAAQDQAVLAPLLGKPLEDGTNPSRDQIRLRFAALAKRPKSHPLVVHLTAPAAVDTAGTVFILPAEAGDNPRNRLTLAELLGAVRDCPAKHKLLILSLAPHDDTRAGDLSAAVIAALEAVADDDRLSLVACGPGQTAHASPELGRTVFAHYLEAGLKGAADDDRDGRVSAKEVADFVRARVARWSVENRATAQTPVLLGSAPDFDLRANVAAASEPPTVGEIAYPDWLRAAWDQRAPRDTILAVERGLRNGRSADEVKRDFDARFARVPRESVPTPDPLPTLAATFPGYVLPEPALVEQLRAAAVAVESKSPTAPGEKPAEPTEFDAFKAKPHALLAAAAFAVLADDADVSAARVKAFAKLLAVQDPQVRFAEVLLIRRLAALTDQGALAPWSGERAALALQTARSLEDAASRPDVVAHARPALDEAYRLRADAEAALFAPGYASPAAATVRLREAEAAARQLKLTADRLAAARAVRDDASQWLTGATALVDNGALNATDAVAVADAVVKLNTALPRRDQQYDATAFAARVPDWDRFAGVLRRALTSANRPLTTDALALFRKRATSPDAGPAVYADLDAVLASPLVSGAERVALWNARSALARKLCEATTRKDAADDEAFRAGGARPVVAEVPSELPRDTAREQRRTSWATALDGARAAEAEPRTDAAHRRLWAWHAGRFEYEARDAFDAPPFLSLVAKACATAAGTTAAPFVEVAPVGVPKLTFDKPSAELKLTLRAVDAPASAQVRALTPADEWLKPVPGATAALDAVRESALVLPLAAGSRPTAHPAALGVLVEVDADFANTRRTFHRRVPVSLRSLSTRVDLLARADAKAAPQPLSAFNLRPNGVPAPYQLVLFNPSPVPQKVIARIAGLGRETAALTLEPGNQIPLVFGAPAKPQAAGKDDDFAPLSDNALSLELLDPADRESVLQTFALPVRVADPAGYLRVSDAVFAPGADGKPNQLSVAVVPGELPGGGAAPVKMLFPQKANPGLVVRDGSQAGNVVAAGKPAKLYVENLAFPSPAGASVTVTLSADGVERVFTYAAQLPALGETVRLQRVTTPRVRIEAPEYARGDKPLAVALEVDDAPSGAKLELLVGTAKDAKAPVVADLTLPIATARARGARFRFDAKGETLELTGTLGDHKPVLPVELLTGKRVLEARLLAPDGAELAKSRVVVVFDGNPPADVKYLDLPPRAAKGAPLAVKATCAPSVAGIKEVRFFVGKPNKDELPAAPAPVPGMRAEGEAEWRANLQMPDAKGVVVVGVKFTTFAGLSTIETQEIELLDAAEVNKPAPGKIAGKLLENRIPQPNATVFLYDEKGAAVAKTATKADGTFEFKDLPPGSYYLFSEKVPTNRHVKEQVEVKAGATTTRELELLLK